METRRCPACGRNVPADNEFCKYCGAPLLISAPAADAQVTQASPSPARRRSWRLGLVSTWVLMLVGGAVGLRKIQMQNAELEAAHEQIATLAARLRAAENDRQDTEDELRKMRRARDEIQQERDDLDSKRRWQELEISRLRLWCN